jgi:hypothetical protein
MRVDMLSRRSAQRPFFLIVFGTLTLAFLVAACGSSSDRGRSSSTTSQSAVPESTPSEDESLNALLVSGEPFNVLISDGQVPELPTSIPGYTRYDGDDRSGQTGGVRTTTMRVFAGQAEPYLIDGFPSQMNGCGDAIWVLRWTAQNEDVLISATHQVGEFNTVIGGPDNPWGTKWARSGIMSNNICLQPGFRFAGTINGNESNLDDLVIEWSFYDTDYFAP